MYTIKKLLSRFFKVRFIGHRKYYNKDTTKTKGDIKMLFVLLLSAIIIIAILSPKNNKGKGVFGVLITLLYFPLGVILALTKKYK